MAKVRRKAHVRRTKAGKTEQVRQHEMNVDKKTKQRRILPVHYIRDTNKADEEEATARRAFYAAIRVWRETRKEKDELACHEANKKLQEATARAVHAWKLRHAYQRRLELADRSGGE